MTFKVFTQEQVDHFISRGHVTLKGALPREQVLAAQDFLWQRVADRGVLRDDQ